MNKEQINQIDDFFVYATFSSSDIKLAELFLQYCNYMDNLPNKVKKDANFDSWKYFTEIEQSKTLFKKRDDAPLALAIHWLSLVREKANIAVLNNHIPEFNFTEENLSKLSHESVDEKKLPLIKDILLQHGIILIYQESLPGMKLDGASFLLNKKIPVIGMTLRYSRLDNYWFVLFHELSHIILHYDKLQSPIFDDLDKESGDDIELDANTLARNSLIPRYKWRNCKLRYNHEEKNVYTFAKELNIHPAIIAGRLQREKNKYTVFSNIVYSVNTKEILL